MLRSTFVSGLRVQVRTIFMGAHICIHHLRKLERRSSLSSVHCRTLSCRARGAYVHAGRLFFVCTGAALSSIRAAFLADEHPLCGKCYEDECGVWARRARGCSRRRSFYRPISIWPHPVSLLASHTAASSWGQTSNNMIYVLYRAHAPFTVSEICGLCSLEASVPGKERELL